MAPEVLHWLAPEPGQIFVDATLGGGGHTQLIAEHVVPGGRVLAIDRDPEAVRRVRPRVAGLPVTLVTGSFEDLPELLAAEGVPVVHGILLDLGLSSDQLGDATRGFSFEADGPLDMRFDPHVGDPAWRLLLQLPERRLADLIFQYGQERYSRRIARAICTQRRRRPVRTAVELAALIRRAVPRAARHQRIDAATRTFQALRIAVNDELGILERALARLPTCLQVGGRLAAISFHSLEDRLVKTAFRADGRWTVLTRKPLRPGAAERRRNARSRSARLRVAERRSEGGPGNRQAPGWRTAGTGMPEAT
jgi:16S rRNA (cytosine1402-N4)-methyltransferase